MDADGAAAANGSEAPAAAAPAPSSLPEVEMFAYLLTIMFLLDHKQYEQVQAAAAGQLAGSWWGDHLLLPMRMPNTS